MAQFCVEEAAFLYVALREAQAVAGGSYDPLTDPAPVDQALAEAESKARAFARGELS